MRHPGSPRRWLPLALLSLVGNAAGVQAKDGEPAFQKCLQAMRPQAIVRALALRRPADYRQPPGRVRRESGGWRETRLFRGRIDNRERLPGVFLFSGGEQSALFYQGFYHFLSVLLLHL